MGSSSSIVRKTTLSDDGDGFTYILSDETPDHYDDVIRAKGWRYKQFAEGNPVALFNHDKGFIVGRWDRVRVEGTKLKGRLVLAPQGSSSRIDEIRALVGAGIIRACSVGFRPIRQQPRANGGIEFLEQELLECSLVAVGANPSALLEARRLGVSNEVIKMVFRAQNRNASLAERIEGARHAVKQYSLEEREEIQRRALEQVAQIKQRRDKAVREAVERRARVQRAAKIRVDKMNREERERNAGVPPKPDPAVWGEYVLTTFGKHRYWVPKLSEWKSDGEDK